MLNYREMILQQNMKDFLPGFHGGTKVEPKIVQNSFFSLLFRGKKHAQSKVGYASQFNKSDVV